MSNSDIGRYMRHMAGETIEEIAQVDNVSLATAEKSVARGAAFESQNTVMQIQKIRDRGALKNEQFRETLRERFEPTVIEAFEKLLKGKSVAVEVDKASGAVTFREYDDAKLLLDGVNLYRKTVSLEEKPQATTLIQNNIQQNNTQNVAPGPEIFDFENTLTKIRRQQKEAHAPRVIETQALPLPETEPDNSEGVDF